VNYLEVAEETAREAAKVLLENLGKVKEIEFKAKNSLVTEVDKLSEKIIISNIKKNFPTHDIFAEESGKDLSDSDYLWLIDPIDGTTNYAHAYPFFSISIALEVKGEVIAGLVYDPVKDEMFTAEKGKGAFLNGEPISVSKSNEIKHSHVCTGFMHEVEWMVEANIRHFGNFIRRARAVRRDGSAALDLCYVACGRFDGFWELGLNPWDTAAAVLIVKEAGGHLCKFNGDAYSIYDKEILATNSIIDEQMMEILSLKEG
jgi:myo-inositol-1(or 4)-monophosphatase